MCKEWDGGEREIERKEEESGDGNVGRLREREREGCHQMGGEG